MLWCLELVCGFERDMAEMLCLNAADLRGAPMRTAGISGRGGVHAVKVASCAAAAVELSRVMAG